MDDSSKYELEYDDRISIKDIISCADIEAINEMIKANNERKGQGKEPYVVDLAKIYNDYLENNNAMDKDKR